jgi:hypothetical protein
LTQQSIQHTTTYIVATGLGKLNDSFNRTEFLLPVKVRASTVIMECM